MEAQAARLLSRILGERLRDNGRRAGGPARPQEEPEPARQVAPWIESDGIADLNGDQAEQVPVGAYKHGGNSQDWT